jgi:peroxiredoxin
VRATFTARIVSSPTGRQLIVRASTFDSKIVFIPAPGSGTDPGEAGRLGAELRKVLRSEIRLLPVDLPPEFPFSEFKGVGSGANHAIALGMQLSDMPAPAGAINSITQSVVGPSGFAFAVRKEFVNTIIDLEEIKAAIQRRRIRITISGPLGSYTVTYKLRFSDGPDLTFRHGAIDVSGRIAVETGNTFAPNGFVSFKQALGLFLDNTTQVVTLERIGAPDVDESWFISHGTAVREVNNAFATALATSASPVRKVFDDARQNLRKGLNTFDQAAVPRYATIAITPDGIIVRGDISTLPRPVAVIDIRDTADGTGFTAFDSWIPGGRVERFTWSWVEYSSMVPSPWSGVTKSVIDEHSFVLAKPAGITDASSICLRIDGTQMSMGGVPIPLTGGVMCLAPVIGPVMNIPAWFDPVTVPIWRPDVAAHMRLTDAIAGHVSVQPTAAGMGSPSQNTLVYFAEWRSERPLEELGAALAELRRRPLSLALIIVVPVGTFAERRKELDGKLAAIRTPFTLPLYVTEDDEGGWTRMFAASAVPATFLINARRQFVWKHDGTPSTAELAAALDRFAVPAPPAVAAPLALSARVRDRAPDAVFDDGHGQAGALHRMRGQRTMLIFWQGWSAPSLRELARLQGLQERAAREGTTIIGFHGGRKEHIDRVRREMGITFALVDDADQKIASAYGVRCWPTTVTVDAAGLVEQVHFGVTHDHGSAYPREEERG